MKNILLDISGKIDKTHIDAISEIKKIADSLEIPFFIIGAVARDFILEHLYNIQAIRRTTDIDLGMKVENWDKFKELEITLLNSGKFQRGLKKESFIYNKVFIDIVPFGEISDIDNKITWPPEYKIIMSVLGFNEVYKFSTTIKLSNNPILEVKIPTLPGLAVLKMLSWEEKYPERKKDAEDLLFIMNKYEFAGNYDRLYESEIKLLESEEFDTRIAGIRLLGKDIANICDHHTLDYIKKIVTEETEDNSNFKLVLQMIEPNDDFDDILNLLKKLKEGIFEA
jgi:predicted nucleotidyltransferase